MSDEGRLLLFVIFNGHSKVCSSVRQMDAEHIPMIHFCAVHTDLFGCIWFQVVWFQQLDVKVFERLSEWRVDFVVQFCQLEEFGVDWWDELRTGKFYKVFQYAE